MAAGSATIKNSTVSGNLAQGGDSSGDGLAGGGGIFASANTTLTGTTVTDNVAQGGDNAPDSGAYGGGFWIYPSTTSISGSSFLGNRALGGNGGTGSFVGIAEGGAINSYGVVTISSSTFASNQAQGGTGGNSGTSTSGPYVDYAFGARSPIPRRA